jgi:hypothetical protein
MDTNALILAAHIRVLAQELRTKAMRSEVPRDLPLEQRHTAEAQWYSENPLHDFVDEAMEELKVIAERFAP